MNYCLVCNKELENGATYHGCLKQFWQEDILVQKLDYELSKIEQLAKENVAQRVIVTGVQPKLSLGFTGGVEKNRLTIVRALNGRCILKPPFDYTFKCQR